MIVLAVVAGVAAAAQDARLIEAATSGDAGAVRALLRDSADVNAREPDGSTALHWAVRADALEVVTLLLEAGAKPDATNDNGATPLGLTAVNGTAAMIDALLDAGADPNRRLPQGQTVLMTAARTGRADALATLLAAGAEVDAREQLLGETALMWAAAENHADAVRVLVAHGAAVEARSDLMAFPRDRFGDGRSARFRVLPRGGWTPLLYAARQNAQAAAVALAAAGADLDVADPDGTTPLVLAIINAHYDFAAMLLERGADPNLGDSRGMTPLYAAVDMHTLDETPGRPPPTPSGTLDAPALMTRLLAHGADPDAPLTGRVLERLHNAGDAALAEGATPLMRAARKGDLASVRLLLAHGADPRGRADNGTTALMYAAGYGGLGRFGEYDERRGTEEDRMQIVELCLDHGAELDAVNAAGQTALHIAALERTDAFVELLAQRGAALQIRDGEGRTALDLARGVGVRARGGAPAAPRESTAALLQRLMDVSAGQAGVHAPR